MLLNAKRMSEQIERPPLETFLARAGQLAARDCTRIWRAEISLAGQHQADTAACQHIMRILGTVERLKGRILACF